MIRLLSRLDFNGKNVKIGPKCVHGTVFKAEKNNSSTKTLIDHEFRTFLRDRKT